MRYPELGWLANLIGTAGHWAINYATEKLIIAQKQGFSDGPFTDWLDDGRSMMITQDFTYTDENLRAWVAVKGTVIDGASIPRVAWRLIGSPFVGKYRRPSVVHDAYYKLKTVPRADVDRMFLSGMKYCGVNLVKRRLMYYAVRLGGGAHW